MSVMIIGINHVTIVVKDKSQAAEFYFNQLGFEKVEVGKSLWAKVGLQYLHINENPNQNNQNTFQHFSIEIDNLIPYLERLINFGVDVFDLDKNLSKKDINNNLHKERRNYFINDPSNNLIEFIDSSNQFFKQ